MRGKRACAVLMMVFLMTASVLVTQVGADGVQYRIYGYVEPDPVDGVRAYDAVNNGFAYFYIQNRTNEGNVVDAMVTGGGGDSYDPYISLQENGETGYINDWQEGDPGIMIVEREIGSYGTNDRAGYIAFQNGTLVFVPPQVFDNCTLQKIPIPTQDENGTGFMNISWTPLNDVNGIIAGYKIYRSDTNASDGDWVLWGGSVNAPLTDLWFNDTTSIVAGTDYYYSVKVVFTGYQNNDTGQVDNYQNQYFGEGSAPMSSPGVAPTVDWIAIVTIAGVGTFNITDQPVDVWFTIQGYAAAYNTTFGYLGDISVDWSVVLGGGSNAFTGPLSGDTSTFNASTAGGTATWTAIDPVSGKQDTVIFTINPPGVDYIEIVDTMGTGASSIPPLTLGVGITVTGYAAGFNTTTGYIGDVTVGWTVTPTALEDATTDPGPATTANFYSGTIDGSVTWTADYGGGITDSVIIGINPPTIDYIRIVDNVGMDIPTQTVNVGYSITGYAAGYNTTSGYIMDVQANWQVIPTAGEDADTTPANGTSSVFNSQTIDGFVTWSVDWGGMTDTVDITISPPTVDYILIVDIIGVDIPTQTVNVGYTITGYAAGYNTTSGYVMDVQADWTVIPTAAEDADTTPTNGTSSVFNSRTIDGFVTWQAEYGGMTDSVDITISPPLVDYILIVDNGGTGATEIADDTVSLSFTITGWAASFNITSGYLGDVSVLWSVGNVGGSTAFTFPLGPSTSSTFDAELNPGTATWEANDGLGHIDTVIYDIIAATVDYIEIVDTSGTGTFPINLAIIVGVGVTITGYAAAFNTTAGYLYDVSVNWTVILTLLENATTTPLMNSDTSAFWSGWIGGTVYWNATDGYGHSYEVVVTIDPPVLNYIEIVDTPGTGTAQIGAQILDVGVTITGYAAGFNDTIGYFGDVTVDWTVAQVGENATTTPGPAPSSDFWSGWIGGTVTWTADYNMGQAMDSVSVTINPPVVNYIEIVDTPGTGTAQIGAQILDVGVTITGYAAGFNDTIGYFGDVTVDWTVAQVGENATTTPGTASSSDFWSGWIGGSVTWDADYNTGQALDSVSVTINPATVDYIQIVDNPGTGTNLIPDQTLVILQTLWGYAASFNNTIGYIGDVSATWTVDNPSTSTAPSPGTSSQFDAGGAAGISNWTADDGALHTYTVTITITPYGTEYIEIVNSPGTGLALIADFSIGVGLVVTGYAAAFNSTAPLTGYIGDVTVTWIVIPAGGANSSSAPGSGTWTDFYSGFFGGTATWTADDGAGHTDMISVTILPPEFNIKIVDTMGTGTAEIIDQDIFVGTPMTGYAAMFNDTIGYFGDIALTWSVDNPGATNASTNPISGSITSDFYSGFFGGTATWLADDLSGHTDTVVFNIIPPGVDYIDIVDTAGTGTFEIMDQAVGVGATITGYAAGFNNSVGYVQDVSATWTIIQGPENATTNPGSGTMSDFWSGWIDGSVDWEADYGGLTDTVTITIDPPTVDYILIRDASENEISGQTVVINTLIYGFAAGFNNTIGFIGNVSVNWDVDDLGSGSAPSTFPASGTSSQFDAGGSSGTAIWTADYGGGITDTVVFSITDIIPDALVIVDGAGSGTFEILDQTTIVGESFLGFAAAFSSATYWGDVSVTWTFINNVGTNANTNPGTGSSSTFYSGTLGGTVTWQASYYESVNGVWLNDTVDFTVDPPTVDYITIVDNAGTGMTEIADQTVPVGFAITGYVASFNYTSLYLGDISVGWTVDLGTASTLPASGLTSDFAAGIVGGTATWTANDPVSGKQDTVVFTISQPTVDYIDIVYSIGTGTNPIANQAVGVGITITGYAAGYNTTTGYVMDVSADWDVLPSGLEDASTDPGPAITADFLSGTIDGSVDWEADYNGMTDIVIITIIPVTIDYIDIVYSIGTGTNPIANQAVGVGITVTGYAAGYNTTIGYVMDVSADWDVLPSGLEDASTDPGPAITADFLSGTVSGSVDWEADYNGMIDTVAITINSIVINYIEIVDTVSAGTTAIPDQSVDVGVTIIGFAAAFNNTIGYVGDVSVDWSVTPSAGEDADTNPTTTTITSTFDSGTVGGSVDWTADLAGLLADTVTITINPPTVDYITIVDTADIGTTEIPDQTVSINIALTGYAASFNRTSDYIGDISVSWTVTPTGSEDASTTPGSGTSSGFDSGTVDGSATWTADDLSGHTDTVVFTISPPTIDYVRIVDAPSETGNIVTGLVYGMSDTDTYYLIGFSDTNVYLGLVEAESWTITPATGVGTLTFTAPSSSVDFTALEVDIDTTFTVTASDTDSGESDTTGTLTVLAPTVDSIKIEDAADNADSEVTSLTMNDDVTEDLYAAGYNTTSGYVMDVDADWTTTLGSVAPATGADMTTYTPAAGTGTLTATYMGLTANVALDVSDVTGPPKPDSLTLEIVDDKVVITFPASPPADVAEYQVQRRDGTTGDWVNVGSRLDADTASFTDEDVKAGKTYGYRIIAYDDADNPSEASDPVDIKIPDKDEGLPWIWLLLLIIIIIIIILLLLFLMTRKKGEEEEMPPEEEAAPEMPEEEMPFEEEGLGVAAVAAPPPGAAGEEAAARLCPNCGGAMEFIEDYDQHYCYTCGKYDSEFEDEGGEGGDEMPEGEGEPPSEEPEGEGPSGEEPPQGDEGPSGDEHREDEGGPESEENPPEY